MWWTLGHRFGASSNQPADSLTDYQPPDSYSSDIDFIVEEKRFLTTETVLVRVSSPPLSACRSNTSRNMTIHAVLLWTCIALVQMTSLVRMSSTVETLRPNAASDGRGTDPMMRHAVADGILYSKDLWIEKRLYMSCAGTPPLIDTV